MRISDWSSDVCSSDLAAFAGAAATASVFGGRMAASIGEGDGAGGCTTGSGLTSGGLTGSGGVGSSTAAGGGATLCGTSPNSNTTGFYIGSASCRERVGQNVKTAG